MLANAGDRVDVVSYDERFVACKDWGSGRACPWPVAVPGAGSSPALPTAPELVAVAQGPFSDVPAGSTHAASITWLVERGITSGCGGTRFCPSTAVTRAQMATFLSRGLGLAPLDDGRFVDVPVGSTHAGAVGALAQAGITSGCGGSSDRFCPDAPVTRAQMASFLRAALN